MNQLLVGIIFFASALMLIFNGPLLDVVGWSYTSSAGSAVTKIHPAFYLLLLASLLAVLSGKMAAIRTLQRPAVILFAFASFLLLIKALFITLRGVNEGELSAIIVTFFIPLLLVISLSLLPVDTLQRAVPALRIFFVVNSVMAIAERLVGGRFIPSFLDNFTSQDRATALLGHPLNAALLTGVLIVYLMTSTQNRAPASVKWAELGLHILAMFAFGGRSALVFTAIVVLMSSLSLRSRSTGGHFGAGQRLLPLIVMLLGICLVFLPIDFIDATLDRFTNDQGSADTRDAAVRLLTMVDAQTLLHGIPAVQRQIYMKFLHTPAGFEISWIALTITYGLLLTIPMMIALPLFLFSQAKGKDRSAFYIALLFMIVTVGSLAIGSKSLILGQTLLMMAILTTPARAPQFRPSFPNQNRRE